MFQNSSIEDTSVLLDRIPDSTPDLLHDAKVWLDREIAPLEDPLRYADPDSDWVLPPFIKQPSQTSPLLACLQTFNFVDAVRRIVIHPDEDTIFTVGSPTRSSQPESTHTIQVWNWRTGDRISSLEGHSAPITAIALSQDGKTLVSGSRDRTIKVWNASTGEELTTLTGHHSPITAIAISADGQTVVSSGCNQYESRDRQTHTTIRDRSLRIWNLPHNKVTHILPCITDIPTLMMAADGQLLKLEQRSQQVNLNTGETTSSLNWLAQDEQLLAITPDRTSAATIVGRQVTVRHVTTGEERCQIQLDTCDRAIHVSALSPDGKWFVAGFQRTNIHPKHGSYLTRQNVLRIWNAQTGEPLGCLSESDLGQGLWQSIEFSQQGRLLVTSVGSGLKVWQCRN
jgi:WD40 repeat protein